MEIVWAVLFYSTRRTWFFNLPSSDAQMNLITLCMSVMWWWCSSYVYSWICRHKIVNRLLINSYRQSWIQMFPEQCSSTIPIQTYLISWFSFNVMAICNNFRRMNVVFQANSVRHYSCRQLVSELANNDEGMLTMEVLWFFLLFRNCLCDCDWLHIEIFYCETACGNYSI